MMDGQKNVTSYQLDSLTIFCPVSSFWMPLTALT